MERPDLVNLVTPPSTTILNTHADDAPNHHVTAFLCPFDSPDTSDPNPETDACALVLTDLNIAILVAVLLVSFTRVLWRPVH
jgi:hypothetical protein